MDVHARIPVREGVIALVVCPPQLVRIITNRLEQVGVEYAVGGSALLYVLGMPTTVRDWDITTDCDLGRTLEALSDLPWAQQESGEYPFASTYRLHVTAYEVDVDVIGQFAVWSKRGVCCLPCIPSFAWQGLHMASPEVWMVAYGLMGRSIKTEFLKEYLAHHEANQKICEHLLRLPLPSDVAVLLEKLLS